MAPLGDSNVRLEFCSFSLWKRPGDRRPGGTRVWNRNRERWLLNDYCKPRCDCAVGTPSFRFKQEECGVHSRDSLRVVSSASKLVGKAEHSHTERMLSAPAQDPMTLGSLETSPSWAPILWVCVNSIKRACNLAGYAFTESASKGRSPHYCVAHLL